MLHLELMQKACVRKNKRKAFALALIRKQCAASKEVVV